MSNRGWRWPHKKEKKGSLYHWNRDRPCSPPLSGSRLSCDQIFGAHPQPALNNRLAIPTQQKVPSIKDTLQWRNLKGILVQADKPIIADINIIHIVIVALPGYVWTLECKPQGGIYNRLQRGVPEGSGQYLASFCIMGIKLDSDAYSSDTFVGPPREVVAGGHGLICCRASYTCISPADVPVMGWSLTCKQQYSLHGPHEPNDWLVLL
jgi:hypothetical protein